MSPVSPSRPAVVALLAVTLVGPLACDRQPNATHDASTHAAEATAPAKSRWICPMHPSYVADGPGSCPICHMDLVEVPPELPGTSQQPEPVPVPVPDSPGTSQHRTSQQPPTHAALSLDATGVALAGVATVEAQRESLRRPLRAAGVVRADEARLHRMQSRVSGWIERLYVATTGQAVRRGEPAFALYSPELLASQQEYLLARQTASRFAGSALPEVRRGGDDLIRAARRRLELLEAPASLFALLEQTGEAQRTVDLVIPASGWVLEKNVVAGQQIGPGDLLYTIADLSTVWVEADFYEAEAALLARGQPGTLVPAYDRGTPIRARLDFLYPQLEPTTRTLRARFVVANRDLRLRPGMFVDVALDLDLGEVIVVPDAAVLDTGTRRLVFVATGSSDAAADTPTRFAPREVEVGWRGDGKAEIRSGLATGERVAAAANFLLDSESRLRAALAALGTADTPPTNQPPASAHAGHGGGS